MDFFERICRRPLLRGLVFIAFLRLQGIWLFLLHHSLKAVSTFEGMSFDVGCFPSAFLLVSIASSIHGIVCEGRGGQCAGSGGASF